MNTGIIFKNTEEQCKCFSIIFVYLHRKFKEELSVDRPRTKQSSNDYESLRHFTLKSFAEMRNSVRDFWDFLLCYLVCSLLSKKPQYLTQAGRGKFPPQQDFVFSSEILCFWFVNSVEFPEWFFLSGNPSYTKYALINMYIHNLLCMNIC